MTDIYLGMSTLASFILIEKPFDFFWIIKCVFLLFMKMIKPTDLSVWGCPKGSSQSAEGKGHELKLKAFLCRIVYLGLARGITRSWVLSHLCEEFLDVLRHL